MLDDITLAMLGDHDKQEMFTKLGDLLPCPFAVVQQWKMTVGCTVIVAE